MGLDAVIAGYLQAAEEELDAVRRLAPPPTNRLAAYHLHQASEKLVKALLIARGEQPSREHRIYLLLDKLPEGDPWRAILEPLDRYSTYATAYRYPGTSGRLRPGPKSAAMLQGADEIGALISRARRELSVS